MFRTLLLAAVCISSAGLMGLAMAADTISEKARKLHFSSIVVDTHDDTTQRFLDGKFDLGTRSATGSIDIPRMREGNLSAIFFSIWIPSKITGFDAVNPFGQRLDSFKHQIVRDRACQARRRSAHGERGSRCGREPCCLRPSSGRSQGSPLQ